MGDAGVFILEWSFLSMGFRGAATFAPLVSAIFLPGRIPKRYAEAAIIAGPVITIAARRLFSFLNINCDSLFAGVGCSILIIMLGYLDGRIVKSDTLKHRILKTKGKRN